MSSDVAERPATRFEGGRSMNTVVKTRYGEVRGSVADGVHTFKGIPFKERKAYQRLQEKKYLNCFNPGEILCLQL